ncbi:hypothetical protein OIU77_005945 [Salix suchowensis]|uniref:Uncharacterized protein n=1 Tax=Salix suchowensis TaxID=1278906 RepID=A0ABQ9ATW3_9ROSI|nr:hypothetical protein OIU77_005945 [Salix suchowensis]
MFDESGGKVLRSGRFKLQMSLKDFRPGVWKRTFKLVGQTKSGSSTDRMPDKHHTDFIKKTMQLHEDIFKQQVRELHRLYSVQKILMEDLEKEN